MYFSLSLLLFLAPCCYFRIYKTRESAREGEIEYLCRARAAEAFAKERAPGVVISADVSEARVDETPRRVVNLLPIDFIPSFASAAAPRQSYIAPFSSIAPARNSSPPDCDSTHVQRDAVRLRVLCT